MLDLVILGGGIAGLAALHQAQKQERLKTRLFEAAPHLGGKVLSERHEGFLIEAGPDAFVPHKPWALELVRELGLEGELLPSRDEHHRLYLAHGSRLLALPAGLQGLVPTRLVPFLRSPLLSWRGKLRLLLEPLVPPRPDRDEESLAAFARRRLGREACERLAEPLLAHVHAADAERLSLEAAFPQLAELERRHGSLSRGVRRSRPSTSPQFWTLRGGMATLVEALSRQLEPGTVELGRKAVGLEPSGSGFQVQLDDGRRIKTARIILALPAFAAAEVVMDWRPELAASLRAIRFVSLAAVSLGYRRAAVEHPLDGFGFLVPSVEHRPLLGVTWVSTKFEGRAPEGHVLVRAFLGGAHHPRVLERSDANLLDLAEQELDGFLGLRGESVLRRLQRWEHAYPQYDVRHLERVARLESACPSGLALAGNSYRGIGLADAVRSGQEAAARVLATELSRRFQLTPPRPPC